MCFLAINVISNLGECNTSPQCTISRDIGKCLNCLKNVLDVSTGTFYWFLLFPDSTGNFSEVADCVLYFRMYLFRHCLW